MKKQKLMAKISQQAADQAISKISPEIQKMFATISEQHRQLVIRMRDIENLLSGAYTRTRSISQSVQKSLPVEQTAPSPAAIQRVSKPTLFPRIETPTVAKRRPGRPRKVNTAPAAPKVIVNNVVKPSIPAGFQTINNFLKDRKIQFDRIQTLNFSNRCRKLVREKGLLTQIQLDAGAGIVRNCYTIELLDQALKSLLQEQQPIPVQPVDSVKLKREQARHVLAL